VAGFFCFQQKSTFLFGLGLAQHWQYWLLLDCLRYFGCVHFIIFFTSSSLKEKQQQQTHKNGRGPQ